MAKDNLKIYEAVQAVPPEAQKKITGGRLNGYTDINPMWRIKTLTDQFGPAGIGWYYEIVDKRIENSPTGEISAFVDINLFVKVDGEWSKPIMGTGGSSFVANEKNGPYTSDECFKMALTDAISVACKALGFGAEVYWKAQTKNDIEKEDLSFHDIYAIKKRIETALTKIIQRMDYKDVLASLEINEKQLNSILKAPDNIAWLESALKKL